MKYSMSYLPIVLIVLTACTKETAPVAEATAAPAVINPWEPIDPGFIGCEGG